MKNTFEDKMFKFIEKHSIELLFLTVTLLAFFVRFILLKYRSGDYDTFLKLWFDELKMYGGLKALGRSIGDYTPIYMSILALLTYIPVSSLISIKMVSILFDFVGAFAVYKIVSELLKDKKYKDHIALLFYALFLFLPTVIMNSSYWAQCDSIYTSFILISLYYLIKNNYFRSLLFFSIALAFKTQAMFILPLYILMYISERKIKLKYFLLIPLVIFICGIPKMIASGNIFCSFEVYFLQVNNYSQFITMNLSNIYSIFFVGQSNAPNLINSPFPELGTIGLITTIMIFIVMAYFVFIKKIKFDKKAIIEFGLFSILICNFLFPQMHDRYLFMGDVIGLLYLILNKDKYYVPIIIEIISLSGYVCYFFGANIKICYFGILYLLLMIFYTKDMIQKYFKL